MKKKPKHTMCYVAGSSGGHIIPALTLAKEHVKEHPDDRILFFSTDKPLDIELISNVSTINRHIALPIQSARWQIKQSFKLAYNWLVSLCIITYQLLRRRPHKVVCTGGFISLPVTVIARILAIPVDWYELNAQPGRATKLACRWSINLLTVFKETATYLPNVISTHTSYPIRFFDANTQLGQERALRTLGLKTTRRTICILGGSQGSIAINNTIKRWITAYPWVAHYIQIIHQTGRQDQTDWHQWYAQHHIPAIVTGFCHTIEHYYTAADMIICRAGAGTLFEVLFFGKPCIIIPLEHQADNHQVANALAMTHMHDELFSSCRQQLIEHTIEHLHKEITKKIHIGLPENHTGERYMHPPV